MSQIKKIAIVGGESTGKSTLCEELAMHFQTVFVPEFARLYLEKLNRPYIESDLLSIAKGQIKLEDEMIQNAKQYLFCDTDMHVLKVWSEHAYHHCDPFIKNQLTMREYDAYIITSPDLPWHPDPLREHPNPTDRNYFFNLYTKLIKLKKKPFQIIEGNNKERLLTSIKFIETLT